MPRRKKEDYKEHKGKFKYISKNYQKDWEATPNGEIEIKSNVEIDDGNVEITTEVPEVADYTAEEMKQVRRKKILDSHPDRGGSAEELKKVLEEDE